MLLWHHAAAAMFRVDQLDAAYPLRRTKGLVSLAIGIVDRVVGRTKCDGQENSSFGDEGKIERHSPDQNDQSIPGGSTPTVAIARDGTHPINPA